MEFCSIELLNLVFKRYMLTSITFKPARINISGINMLSNAMFDHLYGGKPLLTPILPLSLISIIHASLTSAEYPTGELRVECHVIDATTSDVPFN